MSRPNAMPKLGADGIYISQLESMTGVPMEACGLTPKPEGFGMYQPSRVELENTLAGAPPEQEGWGFRCDVNQLESKLGLMPVTNETLKDMTGVPMEACGLNPKPEGFGMYQPSRVDLENTLAGAPPEQEGWGFCCDVNQLESKLGLMPTEEGDSKVITAGEDPKLDELDDGMGM